MSEDDDPAQVDSEGSPGWWRAVFSGAPFLDHVQVHFGKRSACSGARWWFFLCQLVAPEGVISTWA